MDVPAVRLPGIAEQIHHDFVTGKIEKPGIRRRQFAMQLIDGDAQDRLRHRIRGHAGHIAECRLKRNRRDREDDRRIRAVGADQPGDRP